VRTTFIRTLCALAEKNERIWLVTGDLGFSLLEEFYGRFPQRYVNVGVAEQNMIGVAAGLAESGKTVFTYSIANFATLRCLEQIRNDVCYHSADVKVVSVGGGLSYGPQGYTHHGIEDLAILRALPGMTVVAPGDPVETDLATRAVAAHRGPCYLRLGKASEPVVHAGVSGFSLGRAIEVCPGTDAALITTGGMLAPGHAACDALRREGCAVALYSMPTVKPLDTETIASAARCGVVITAEEHTIVGGLGGAVAEVLAEATDPRPRLARYALPDRLHHLIGKQEFIRESVAGDLTAFVRRAVAGVRPLAAT
jgi:transketolase